MAVAKEGLYTMVQLRIQRLYIFVEKIVSKIVSQVDVHDISVSLLRNKTF